MWRNTGQPVRLLMLDARACLPILSVMVYWSWPTLYIAIIGVAFFSAISFFGLTLPAMTRLLDRAVGLNSAQEPDDRRAVFDIGVARQALAAGDRPGTLRAIDDALAAPYMVARRAQPLPATPSPVVDVTLPPPSQPSVTYALLPGHWQLEGARYIWVPPETALRRVEARPLIEGRYVWRDGEWH